MRLPRRCSGPSARASVAEVRIKLDRTAVVSGHTVREIEVPQASDSFRSGRLRGEG
jgi:hypothetical protein